MINNTSITLMEGFTTPLEANAGAKKGHYIAINGRPCKIADVSTSKTGKHGHAKAVIVGIDIFTGKKMEYMTPTSHNIDVPIIKRTKMMVSAIDDEYLVLLDDNGETKEDLKIPEGKLGKEIVENYENEKEVNVEIVSSMGEEHVLGYSISK